MSDTDIVERLLNPKITINEYEYIRKGDREKAAAEIERLRGLLALDAKITPGYELLASMLAKRNEEIERLRALLTAHNECSTIDEACGHDKIWTQRFRKLVAETRAALTSKLSAKQLENDGTIP